MKIGVTDHLDGDHAEAWDSLLSQAANGSVFLRAGWLRAWQATFNDGQPMLVVYAEQAPQDWLAAAAFVIKNNTLVFAGQGPSDYADIMVHRSLTGDEQRHVISQILREALRQLQPGNGASLFRIHASSPTTHHLLQPARQLYATATRGARAPRMCMTVVEEKLKKKSLRRHHNKLSKMGQLERLTFTCAQQIMPLLPEFFAQHIARWQSTTTPSLFNDSLSRAFYEQMTRELAAAGVLRFAQVLFDEKPVAFHYGFYDSRCFTWYKPSYDPEMARYSPGEVLMKYLLEQAQAEQADWFDFTIGDEPFKYRYATEDAHIARVIVRNKRWQYWQDRLKAAARRRLQSEQGN